MILATDFRVEIGCGERGQFVRVTHLPTGLERVAECIADQSVGTVRDQIVRELLGLVYRKQDFRVDYICGEPSGIIRVTHIPTGHSRTAEMTTDARLRLIDELLQELHQLGARPA